MDYADREVAQVIRDYEENEYHPLYRDLTWARNVIIETKDGDSIPIDPETNKPKYFDWNVETARDIIKDHRNTRLLMRKLEILWHDRKQKK